MDNLIVWAFSIINHLNLSTPPFYVCVSKAYSSKKMPTLLHNSFVFIWFISLSDCIILNFRLYCSASQVTNSCISGRFSSFLPDWVKYLIAILEASYITTITWHITAPSLWKISYPFFKSSHSTKTWWNGHITLFAGGLYDICWDIFDSE